MRPINYSLGAASYRSWGLLDNVWNPVVLMQILENSGGMTATAKALLASHMLRIGMKTLVLSYKFIQVVKIDRVWFLWLVRLRKANIILDLRGVIVSAIF